MIIEIISEKNCCRYPRDSGSEHGGLWQEGPGSDRGPRWQNGKIIRQEKNLRWGEDQGGLRWEEPMSEVEWGGLREGGGGQRGHNHDGHRYVRDDIPWIEAEN